MNLSTRRSALIFALLLSLAVASRDLKVPFEAVAFISLQGALLCLLLKQGRQQMGAHAPLIVTGMLLYIGVLFFNLVTSQAVNYSLQDASLIAIFPLSFFAFLPAAENTTEDFKPSRLTVYLLPVVVMAMLGIAETLVLKHRSMGTFYDINTFAAFMYLGMLPLAGALMRKKGSVGPWLLVALLCVALSTADSRGAYLATTLGLGLLIVAALLFKLAGKRIAVIVILCIVVCSVGNLTLAPQRSFTFWGLLTAPKASIEKDSVSIRSRFDMWHSAVTAYRVEAPIWGTGLGTYKLAYPKYRNPREVASSGDQAHNDYVQWLLEGGPLLLFGLLVIGVVIPLALLWRAITSRKRDPDASWEAICFLVPGLAIAVHASVNFLYKDPVVALLLGAYFARATVLLSSGRQVASKDAPTVRLAARLQKFVWLTTLPLIYWLIVNTASIAIFYGDHAPSITWPASKVYKTSQAIHLLNPWDPYALNAMSLISLSLATHSSDSGQRGALLQSAGADIKSWIKTNRWEPYAWLRLAALAKQDVTIAGGKPEEFMLIAHTYNPTNLLVDAELALQLLASGDFAGACAISRDGAKWLPIATKKAEIRAWADAAIQACKETGSPAELHAWHSLSAITGP